MLLSIEVRQFDHGPSEAAALLARALPDTDDRHEFADASGDARQRAMFVDRVGAIYGDRLLQEERHARRRALIAQRAQPLHVTRASSRPRLGAGDYPANRVLPRAIAETCWNVIPNSAASLFSGTPRDRAARIAATCSVVSFAA